jgi:hypothetical protein
MKTAIISAIAAAGLALSISSAFAFSNSPEGRVIVNGEAAAVAGASQEQASPSHFLSGDEQSDSDFGQSSNAIQGRDFLNAQKGRY